MWTRILCCASFVGLMSCLAQAQTAPDIEAFAIPADVIKQQRNTPNPYVVTYRYFLRKPDGSRGDLVGIEHFHDNPRIEGDEKLIKRELFKMGNTDRVGPRRRHGIQREWYLNGQLKSEEPYRMHRMDGLFRHWDEQGRLIGQYQMIDGNGTSRLYNANGQLVEEKNYKNNREEGFNFFFVPRTQYAFGWQIADKFVGTSYVFFGERLAYISFMYTPPEGVFGYNGHGPNLRFDLGTPEMKKNPDLGHGFAYAGESREWWIKGKKVSEEEYAAAVQADKTLPPYYKDLERYKEEFVTPEIKTLLKKYMETPRVKIPLEFDAKGEPVPAPPDTPWIVEPNLFEGTPPREETPRANP